MNSLNGSTQRSSSPLSGTGMQRSSSQNELLKSTLSRVILDGSPVVIERKPSVVSLSGSPLTRKNNEDSASIPSLLQGLGPLEALMDQDPSNIVQLLPDIASHLQQECISNPSLCPIIWDSLKSLLEQVNEAGKEHRQGAARSLTLNPPFCEAKPTTIINCHGEEWTDNYGWLNDRNNQDVLDYIEAENKYADAKLESSKPLQKLLYKEFVSRLNDNAESARVTLADGWTYYSKFVYFLLSLKENSV